MSQNILCPKCHNLVPSSNFCSICGSKLMKISEDNQALMDDGVVINTNNYEEAKIYPRYDANINVTNKSSGLLSGILQGVGCVIGAILTLIFIILLLIFIVFN